eukprot:Em0004g513a
MEVNSTNATSVSTALQFPALAEIFTPILMVELLVGLVSNILLLTLLVKARRFQNNVNVYLCSMAVNNMSTSAPWLSAVYAPIINFTGIVSDQAVGSRTNYVYTELGCHVNDLHCTKPYATCVHQSGEI